MVNDKAYGKTIQNTAFLGGKNTEPVSGKDPVPPVIEDGEAALMIDKTVNKTTFNVGETVTYDVKVTNRVGSTVDAEDVVMTDILPEGISYQSASIVETNSSSTVTYNGNTREVRVFLDDMSPNQTLTVRITGLVNDAAYDKTLTNTATATSENTAPVSDSVDIYVNPGQSDVYTTGKTPNKTNVKPGDTVTYTITVGNRAGATKAAEGVVVTDVLPEGMTFANNVSENNSAAAHFTYTAATRTLKLTPPAIEPGDSVTYKFDVVIDDGQEGTTIVNKATIDPGDPTIPDIETVSPPITIPAGNVTAHITKTHTYNGIIGGEVNVTSDKDEYIVDYSVTIRNTSEDGSWWKDVHFEDSLPEQTTLVDGAVYVDGVQAMYTYVGNSISVTLGDMASSGATSQHVINYRVHFFDSNMAYQTKTDGTQYASLVNNAKAIGSNYQTTPVSDITDVVKDITHEPGKINIEKSVEKTVLNLQEDSKNTYTIRVTNNDNKTWENVMIHDPYDRQMLSFYRNSFFLDGVRINNFSVDTTASELIIPVGDIEPGQTKTVQFSIFYFAEAVPRGQNTATRTNRATASSTSHPNVTDDAQAEVLQNPQLESGIHKQLMGGSYTPSGQLLFIPYYRNTAYYTEADGPYLTIYEAAATLFRGISSQKMDALIKEWGGRSYINSRETANDYSWQKIDPIMFFRAMGDFTETPDGTTVYGLSLWDVDIKGRANAVGDGAPKARGLVSHHQLAKMALGLGLTPSWVYSASGVAGDKEYDYMDRAEWANHLCLIFKRDQHPDTSGVNQNDLYKYQDEPIFGQYADQIKEVSNYHLYYRDLGDNGQPTIDEYWYYVDNTVQKWDTFDGRV